jgi:CheY-like chemotaxis protein
VAIIDIGLPGINGYEVARRIRSAGEWAAATRLVAMTGYSEAADRQLATEAGFDLLLVKPVEPAVLRRDALAPQLERKSRAEAALRR